MTDIIAHSLKSLSPRQIQRLKEMLIAEESFWAIEAELGVSKIVSKLLAGNLAAFIRQTEKRAGLRLVYYKEKAA